MSETKVISTRVTAAEFARLGALAEAQGITIAELARAILGSNGALQTAEIVAALEQLIDRINPAENASNAADFEALNVRLAGIERALSAALDALEQLQNSAGYTATGSEKPTAQNSLSGVSFYAWLRTQPPALSGETTQQYNARKREEFASLGGIFN